MNDAARQMPCPPPIGKTGASLALAELASSPAKVLSGLPPGALTIFALLMISHFAKGATGTFTVTGISTLSNGARLGLLLLH